jgi:CheY-like chemotaxis protein
VAQFVFVDRASKGWTLFRASRLGTFPIPGRKKKWEAAPAMSIRQPNAANRLAPAQRLTALIVDHEPLAREWLRRSLEGEGGVDVLGECADGFEAVELIRGRAPDLVFLEVELPGLGGFDVLGRSLSGPGRRPAFVFVTADERHAMRAFAAGVLDYVLKPVDGDSIVAAVRRARQERSETDERSRVSPFRRLAPI